jgi:hypothetical protein
MSSVTIESTEASFLAWRMQRISRSELIPEHLWNMALGLYPQYKRTHICRQLRLHGGQFKQRLDKDRDTRINHGFVLASRDEPKSRPESNPKVQLTLQGHARSMTLCFDVHALAQILPHVGALL